MERSPTPVKSRRDLLLLGTGMLAAVALRVEALFHMRMTTDMIWWWRDAYEILQRGRELLCGDGPVQLLSVVGWRLVGARAWRRRGRYFTHPRDLDLPLRRRCRDSLSDLEDCNDSWNDIQPGRTRGPPVFCQPSFDPGD